MRLIDADSLKEKAVDADYIPTWKWLSISDLESAPTIDPVTHGNWEKLYDRNYKCSYCGAWFSLERDSVIKGFKYCPNCGASMNYHIKEVKENGE